MLNSYNDLMQRIKQHHKKALLSSLNDFKLFLTGRGTKYIASKSVQVKKNPSTAKRIV